AALVYGLSNAATTPNGVSHWGDAKVVAALAAAAVFLGAFWAIEARSKDPLLPFRVLRSRDRAGAYLIMLCAGTGLLGMFFFLNLFLQDVWGYSALRTGLAFLPFPPAFMATSALTQRAVTRIGPRPLLVAGSAVSAGAMIWLSRLTEHSSFVGGVLGPMLLLGAGMGPLFVLLFLLGLTKVRDDDTGVASSMVNVAQQVGGAIGLAIVGTVAWSAVASNLRSALHGSALTAATAHVQIYRHALATGFSGGYLVSAGVLAVALIVALVVVHVRRSDLSGVGPTSLPEPEELRADSRHHGNGSLGEPIDATTGS
ncbi:MAG: MFS transporter, partial [Acidimicrobiales bacterium]